MNTSVFSVCVCQSGAAPVDTGLCVAQQTKQTISCGYLGCVYTGAESGLGWSFIICAHIISIESDFPVLLLMTKEKHDCFVSNLRTLILWI